MKTHADKRQENIKQLVAHDVSKKQHAGAAIFQLVNNGPEAVAQRKLQGLVNNSPRVQQLKAIQNIAAINAAHNEHTIQRWPDIQTPSGTFQYSLGHEFQQRHIAPSKQAAMDKARQLYDPNHTEGSHSAYVTVIYGDITGVTQGSDAVAFGGYHWSISIDVEAVCMGPRGIRGANGDPGQMDEHISSVNISGYGAGTSTAPAKITHVSTSI